MSEYIVEMKNITKRFPGIVANNNVTIQIKKGEIYALLGENDGDRFCFFQDPDGLPIELVEKCFTE